MVDNDLLSVKKTLALVPLGERTLRGLLASGEIPFVRISPGRIAIYRRDLDAYLQAHRCGPKDATTSVTALDGKSVA